MPYRHIWQVLDPFLAAGVIVHAVRHLFLDVPVVQIIPLTGILLCVEPQNECALLWGPPTLFLHDGKGSFEVVPANLAVLVFVSYREKCLRHLLAHFLGVLRQPLLVVAHREDLIPTSLAIVTSDLCEVLLDLLPVLFVLRIIEGVFEQLDISFNVFI